jgi:hypothetical protein
MNLLDPAHGYGECPASDATMPFEPAALIVPSSIYSFCLILMISLCTS